MIQIVKLGGAVVLEPDTAVTHIIYEGRAPGALARELGLGSLDDLPEGCVCVKWEWVANCKLQVGVHHHCILAVGMWAYGAIIGFLNSGMLKGTDAIVVQVRYGSVPVVWPESLWRQQSRYRRSNSVVRSCSDWCPIRIRSRYRREQSE
jgi:hypothetical protein